MKQFTATLCVLLVLLTACASDEPAAVTPGATAILAPATEAALDIAATATSAPLPTATSAPQPTATDEPAPTATSALLPTADAAAELTFSGDSALAYAAAQLDLGPRWPGSPGHVAVGDLIIDELVSLGWEVEVQPLTYQGVDGRNLIARANLDAGSIIMLGAHYDTRRLADQTEGAAAAGTPVPGAVDGASGVAVLLELARTLDLDRVPHELWLAFFDFEDNGAEALPGWDWIVGSTYMAENLTERPGAMILVDMVGQHEQEIYFEGNSDPTLRTAIWATAAELGYRDDFIPELRYTMIDDHVPFIQQGIASVDLIDFDYPYWHTVEDTLDKLSADSLEAVGRTLEVWLETE